MSSRNTIQEEIDAYKDMVMKIIEKNGRFIQAVGSGDDATAYMYSAGNCGKGIPEIFVDGMRLNEFASTINHISELMEINPGHTEADYQDFVDQAVCSLTVKGEPVRVRLVPVSFSAVRKDRILGHATYGYDVGSIKLLQLIWPDDRNILPGEPGYNSEKFPQKVYS